MDRFDLQADCVRALAAQGRKPKKRTNGIYEFRCHQHDDRNASAWVGEAMWGCSGCGIDKASIADLCESLGIAVQARAGFTVEQYAERKGFSLDSLARWGVRTVAGKYGDDVVSIPYRAADGSVLREKHRTANKSFWDPKGVGTYLYGLDVLAKAEPSEAVIVVEGESDCHACWHKRVLAVGVPGATAWRSEWTAELAGRPVYIWQEPGEAGAKFAQALSGAFPVARILRSETHKDLADLYKASPTDFKPTLESLKSEALPLGAIPPKVKYAPLIGSTLTALWQRKLAPIEAVPTPIPTWNRACRDEGGGKGLARGWNVTLAGNTGHGKSLLALNVGAQAIREGEHVAFHSIEMSLMQLATRTLAIVTGISVCRLEQGDQLCADDWNSASKVMAGIHERTGGMFYVNEGPISHLEDVEAAIRYQHEYAGCRFHIVDYLQLCRVAHARDVVEAVPLVSGKLRELAKDLSVTIVGLSQFNRQTSTNKEQPPSIQGLMGGSALENDSDQVILLNHSNYVKTGEGADTELLLAKNRHGPSEDIPVSWDYRTLTLTERFAGPLESERAA